MPNSQAERRSLLSNLLHLSWPTVVYTVMETLVGLVDIYFASFISDSATAALGFSRQIFLVLMIGTLAITTGTITLISQYCGARRYDLASSAAAHSLALAIAAGLVLGALGALLAEPALMALGAKPDVLEHGAPYLRILLGGVVFLMINFSTNAVFRAQGDALTPLKIALCVNLLNVLFSYVFLFGFWFIPSFGVMGIAIGTLVARAVGGAAAIIMLLDRKRLVSLDLSGKMQWSMMSTMLTVGTPSGLSGFLRNGARIVFLGILAATSASTAAVTAAAIGFQIRLFAIMPALAFQVATASLVGQSMGAGRINRAEDYAWTAIRFCSVVMAAISLAIIAAPEWIMRIFTNDMDTILIGAFALRWIALEQFCNCVSIVAGGALSGAGDTRPSMRYTLLSQWLIMLPLAVTLAYLTPWDVYGAWVAWGIAPAIQTVLTLRRVHCGAWKTLNAANLANLPPKPLDDA